MANYKEANKTFVQDDLLNIKEYLLHFSSKWYWFLISCIFGLALGYFIYLYQKPVFQVEASLVISNDKKDSPIANFFEENGWSSSKLIDNQIGIIKSFTLNRQVLEKLNWRVSWYKSGLFTDIGLYKAEPFVVSETPLEKNATGVPIKIKVISPQTYTVSIEKFVKINGTRLRESFTQDGRFGVPFSCQWFHFTLTANGSMKPDVGEHYVMEFNDIKGLVDNYRKNLVVSLLRENSEILSLKVKGNEPSRDIDYLNELAKVFIDYGLTEKNKSSENTIRFIDMQLTGISDSLRRSAQKFSDFRSTNKIFDLSQEGTIAVDKMSELESQKSLADMRLNYYRNLRNYLGNAEQMKQVVAPSVVGITDPLFNGLVVSLVELYRKREVLSYSAGELSPNIEILDKEIKLTQKNLNESIKNLLANAEVDVKSINDQLALVNRQVAKLPGMEQQMISIKGRFEMNNEMNNFLLKKKAEAAITMASNSADAHILDAAYPETTLRLGPDRTQFLLVGFLLGLLLPMLIIVIYDFFNDRIRSMDQLSKRTPLPVLGAISHNNYKTDYPVMDHPRAAISESFRGLRTNIQFLNPDSTKKVISMHSIIPGEGKTFVSLNLATIIALNNKKVLLVGADLRKPRLQRIFGQKDALGLSNYLIDQLTFDEILIPTNVKTLSFIASGSIPPNPAELLESPQFDRFLDEARSRFDVIVIDNAPISIITDSFIVGNKSDINIVVVRQEYSYKNHVKLINETAKQGSLKNMAVVLNDVLASGYGYGKQYGGYGYSYKYGGNYYSDTPKTSFFRKLFKKKK
jgi:tyrosine-protein kinase Etk/Wzc